MMALEVGRGRSAGGVSTALASAMRVASAASDWSAWVHTFFCHVALCALVPTAAGATSALMREYGMVRCLERSDLSPLPFTQCRERIWALDCVGGAVH